MESIPLVAELQPTPEPERLFLQLCHLPHCMFLDSALPDPKLGRYSFLAADPFDFWQRRPEDTDSLGELGQRLSRFRSTPIPGLPPFQGGAAGVLGYELGRQLEQLPATAFDEFKMPALAIGLYDVVVAFDHVQRQAWLISQGLPETEPNARRRRARQRMDEFLGCLSAATRGNPRSTESSHLSAVSVADLAPQYAVPGPKGLTSNFSEADYLAAAQRAIDYIAAGDVFQVNLSQRLLSPAQQDSVTLYLRLRERNPAPFAGYFDLGDFQVVSASPERFLQVQPDGWVETRPIKGTRPRTAHAETDRRAAEDLCRSEKDRAENVMIVDLLRNDLSRVCRPDSVEVRQLCGLETYQYVQHLVSVVRGQFADHVSPIDLIRAAFPGGSVTGAPKVRAMEIIAELERTARGPYCGSLGYLGFDGSLDLSILIRTITAGRGWWQAPVGGGIVAQSLPRDEYEETWHKAEGLLWKNDE